MSLNITSQNIQIMLVIFNPLIIIITKTKIKNFYYIRSNYLQSVAYSKKIRYRKVYLLFFLATYVYSIFLKNT